MCLFHYQEHLIFLDLPYSHPIYTHIPPQYAGIGLFLSISGYNRMNPLLTIDGRFLKMNRLFAFLVVVLPLLVTTPASASDPCNCKGYSGPGGPCYAGPGGPATNKKQLIRPLPDRPARAKPIGQHEKKPRQRPKESYFKAVEFAGTIGG